MAQKEINPTEHEQSDEHIPPEYQGEEVKKEEPSYCLVVSGTQVRTLLRALDLFARIGAGQFEEVLHHPAWEAKRLHLSFDKPEEKEKIDDFRVAGKLLQEAKRLATGYAANASSSIVSADVDSRRAFDIYQVMANMLAWKEHPEGGMGVNFNEPKQWSDQPLPVMAEERELVGALRWLLDDLSDAGEDKNPETGETYDSVQYAVKALARYKREKDGKVG